VECGLSLKLKRAQNCLPALLWCPREKNVAAFGCVLLVTTPSEFVFCALARKSKLLSTKARWGKPTIIRSAARWAGHNRAPSEYVGRRYGRGIPGSAAYRVMAPTFTVRFLARTEVRARCGRQESRPARGFSQISSQPIHHPKVDFTVSPRNGTTRSGIGASGEANTVPSPRNTHASPAEYGRADCLGAAQHSSGKQRSPQTPPPASYSIGTPAQGSIPGLLQSRTRSKRHGHKNFQPNDPKCPASRNAGKNTDSIHRGNDRRVSISK